MGIREDIAGYLADYRGLIGWDSFTEAYTGAVRPSVQIPVYIKQASVPIRKLKMTELSTIPTTDPGTQKETTTNIVFFNAPDILQTQLTGWTITPVVNNQWAPVDITGSPLNYGQLSYNDIIGYYIQGRFNRNTIGSWQRQDPNYYITPRGHVYLNPIISVWQPQAQPTMKKQAFEMTLFLES